MADGAASGLAAQVGSVKGTLETVRSGQGEKFFAPTPLSPLPSCHG